MFLEFERVDTFTCGTVGRPGQRTFLIDVRGDAGRVTVKCEKQQVAALSQYLRQLLDDAPDVNERPIDEAMEMPQPGDVGFVVGTIGIAYDPRNDRMLVQIDELTDRGNEDDDPDEPSDDVLTEGDGSRLRVHLTRGQAAAFCDRADDVVAAGRPQCTFCHMPIDPEGHACPRMN
jgi:uncharacterized repeat protein (TIGR03847 family)